jgi:hypothetical protein
VPAAAGVAGAVTAAAFRGAAWRHRVAADSAEALCDAPMRTPPGAAFSLALNGVCTFLRDEAS